MTELATTTAEQAAEQYARLVREGSALLDEADRLMIRTALEEMAAGIRQRITEQEARIAAAEPELASAQAELDRLRAELAECIARAGSVQAATADDDLTTRVTARSLKLAFQEEATALQARVDGAEAAVRQHDETAGLARAEIEAHAAELATVAAAIERPFTHPLAQETRAYACRVWSGRTMPLLSLGAADHPEYDDAFTYLLHLVRVTGFGAEHEARVEAGVKDRYSDVHFNGQGVPYVYRQPTPEQVAAAARPAIRLPNELERANASPFERQHGIPGVKPADAAMV